MTTLLIEKRLLSLPAVLTPDTVYLIKNINNQLDIYVSDNAGDYAIKQATTTDGTGSDNYTLVTTSKIEIIDNRILLPSTPLGDVVHNVMLVYELDYEINNVVTDYDSVTIVNGTDGSFAVLNENENIRGYGVVSYLTRIV